MTRALYERDLGFRVAMDEDGMLIDPGVLQVDVSI